jgi:hypothetical protein
MWISQRLFLVTVKRVKTKDCTLAFVTLVNLPLPSSAMILTTKPCSDFEWHHWACVYDQETKTRTIYRDGAEVAKQENVPANYQGSENENLYLGKGLKQKETFAGRLTELKNLGCSLSAEEIEINSKNSA